jgi:hypothetical protein
LQLVVQAHKDRGDALPQSETSHQRQTLCVQFDAPLLKLQLTINDIQISPSTATVTCGSPARAA